MNAKTKPADLDDIAESIASLTTMVAEQFDIVNERFEQVDKRFEQVDKRFEQVDIRLDGIENRLFYLERQQTGMREWLERIDSRLSGIESDIANIYDRIVILEKKDTRNLTKADKDELEQKITALLLWAKKVSQKTGISMPKV